jgi:hypothetical protein
MGKWFRVYNSIILSYLFQNKDASKTPDQKPLVANKGQTVYAVYYFSIGLLILVMKKPIIGLSTIDHKIDLPYPISLFSPMYFAIKCVRTI